jgi:SOS-response transcriptional repressor LexA
MHVDSALQSVRILGAFSQGQPLDLTVDDEAKMPRGLLAPDESLVRVVSPGPDRVPVCEGDVLIVQKDVRVVSGRLVLVEVDGRVYLGHWRASRGRTALFDSEMRPIMDGPAMHVLGVVTLIAREERSR